MDNVPDDSTMTEDHSQRALKQLDLLQKSLVASPSLQKQKSTRQETEQRAHYRNRLESFQSATYFAKPCRLSPILVARFGWRNTEKDVLQCDGCQAVVAVIFNPLLSKTASDRLVGWYEEQMSQAHTDSCPFRRSAAQYYGKLFSGETATTSQTTPRTFPSAVLTSVLPPQEVELLEYAKPNFHVQILVKQLLLANEETAAITKDTNDSTTFLKLQPFQDIPPHVQTYPQSTSQAALPPLSCRLTERLFPLEGSSDWTTNVDRIVLETAVLYTLFGWRLDTLSNSTIAEVHVHCPLCLASMQVAQRTENSSGSRNTEGTEGGLYPALKRARIEARPWNAHKYYCPYTCGFPCPPSHETRVNAQRGKPLWQVLADRLLSLEQDTSGSDTTTQEPRVEQNETKEPSAWMKIHQFLSLGLANPTKQQSRSKRGRENTE